MPVKTKRDEEKWDKAKEIAEESGHKEDWAYITGIYKKMEPDYEFKSGPAKQAGQKYRVSLFSDKPGAKPLWTKTFSAPDEGRAEQEALRLVKPKLDQFENAEDWIVEPVGRPRKSGKQIRLTPKEIQRSDAGYVIITRPQASGKIWVVGVNVKTGQPVGKGRFVESKRDVPKAVQGVARDMDKFYGLGGKMTDYARHRDKLLAGSEPTIEEARTKADEHERKADTYTQRARMNPGGPDAKAKISHGAAATAWRRVHHPVTHDLDKRAWKKAIKLSEDAARADKVAEDNRKEIERIRAKFKRQATIHNGRVELAMTNLLAILRALQWSHWTAHWQSQGEHGYQDHLLFERLYNALADEIDTLAEKAVAVCGSHAVDPVQQARTMHKALLEMSREPNLARRGLKAEQMLQQALITVRNMLDAEGALSLGLDDYLAGVANTHETHQYLLQQRLTPAALLETPDRAMRLAGQAFLRHMGRDVESFVKRAMQTEMGPGAADKSWQAPFPTWDTCPKCGGTSVLAFSAYEMMDDDDEGPLVKDLFRGSDGGLWLHDAGAWAVYHCRDCLEASVKWNQA